MRIESALLFALAGLGIQLLAQTPVCYDPTNPDDLRLWDGGAPQVVFWGYHVRGSKAVPFGVALGRTPRIGDPHRFRGVFTADYNRGRSGGWTLSAPLGRREKGEMATDIRT